MSSSKVDLKKMALDALAFSYSPYSQKRIGAAVLLANGQSYSGTNIENASYGGTVCAERVAIWKAYSENLATHKLTEVVVSSEADSPWPPCGFCRQVMAEFGTPDTKITLINPSGVSKSFILKDLLPEAFGPQNFKS
jgi:cytidine deaminase